MIPERDKGIPRARIPGSAADSGDVVAAELPEELARKKAVQPGTSLRLVYELPPNRTKTGKSGFKYVELRSKRLILQKIWDRRMFRLAR